MLVNLKKIKTIALVCGLFIYAALLTGCLQQAPASTETTYTGIDYSNVAFLGSDQTKMIFNKSINNEVNIYMRDISDSTSAEIAITYDSKENLCVRGCSYLKNIVFTSNKNGSYQLYKTSSDNTSEVTQLTSDSNSKFLDAAYSRDGSYIVFTAISTTETDKSCICTYNTSTRAFNSEITSADGIKRKPTMSSDNRYILYQKKVNNRWGLYYVDLNNPTYENEFLANSSVDYYDAEFNSQSLFFMYGTAGTQAYMGACAFPNKSIYPVDNKDYSYYCNQPTVSNDVKTTLYLQKNSSSKFNIWKYTSSGHKQITY
ncbi:MAG: hypothetical protein QMC67_11895 [Candidatus Wallbacteria bacterium]